MIPRALPLALSAALALAGGEEGPSAFALRGARLETGDGTVIPDAVVVVRDGRIEAAGPAASTPIPAGLAVVDAAGGTVMPASVVAATRLGLPGPQGAADRPTPGETVEEECPPAAAAMENAAREGIAILGLLPGPGAPGGEGRAARPSAAGTPAFLVPDGRFLRVDVDPSTGWAKGLAGALDAARKEVEAEDRAEKEQAAFRAASAEFEARKAALEKQFQQATEAWQKEKAAAEKEAKPVPAAPVKGDPGKPPEAPKPVKSEPRTAVVRDALRRKVRVVVVAGSAADAERALDVLAPFRLRLAFRVSGDAWRAAPRLSGAGAAVLLEPGTPNAPGSLDRVNPAAVFEAAGCPVALLPRDESRRGLAAFRAEVGLLVRAGFPRAAAVRGLSLEGARILGLESTAGTVAAGRPADLLLFDGDPLEPATRLRTAWFAGKERR